MNAPTMLNNDIRKTPGRAASNTCTRVEVAGFARDTPPRRGGSQAHHRRRYGVASANVRGFSEHYGTSSIFPYEDIDGFQHPLLRYSSKWPSSRGTAGSSSRKSPEHSYPAAATRPLSFRGTPTPRTRARTQARAPRKQWDVEKPALRYAQSRTSRARLLAAHCKRGSRDTSTLAPKAGPSSRCRAC